MNNKICVQIFCVLNAGSVMLVMMNIWGTCVVGFTLGITSVILACMKTAVSIPNPLFETAEAQAKQLGISRSKLYARALSNFVRAYDKTSITERLNELYATEDRFKDC